VILLAASVGVGLVGCGGSDSTSPTTTREPVASSAPANPSTTAGQPSTTRPTTTAVDAAERSAATAAIAATDLADPASLQALDAVGMTDAGVVAAAEALASGATGDALWAATWIYAGGGIDPAPLEPLLTADDATVRAMAAASLLAQGVRAAAGPLVALSGSEEPVRGARPPLLLGAFAASTLARYVSGPELADGTSLADAAAAWSAWMSQHGASMTYDDGTGRWSA
jgi:hypothetical protein